MGKLILSYIDPGTGSMLFTIIIGLAAALVYAFKGFFIVYLQLVVVSHKQWL